jgi:hypothetical protein
MKNCSKLSVELHDVLLGLIAKRSTAFIEKNRGLVRIYPCFL